LTFLLPIVQSKALGLLQVFKEKFFLTCALCNHNFEHCA